MNSAQKNYYNIKINASSIRGDENEQIFFC